MPSVPPGRSIAIRLFNSAIGSYSPKPVSPRNSVTLAHKFNQRRSAHSQGHRAKPTDDWEPRLRSWNPVNRRSRSSWTSAGKAKISLDGRCYKSLKTCSRFCIVIRARRRYASKLEWLPIMPVAEAGTRDLRTTLAISYPLIHLPSIGIQDCLMVFPFEDRRPTTACTERSLLTRRSRPPSKQRQRLRPRPSNPYIPVQS